MKDMLKSLLVKVLVGFDVFTLLLTAWYLYSGYNYISPFGMSFVRYCVFVLSCLGLVSGIYYLYKKPKYSFLLTVVCSLIAIIPVFFHIFILVLIAGWA